MFLCTGQSGLVVWLVGFTNEELHLLGFKCRCTVSVSALAFCTKYLNIEQHCRLVSIIVNLCVRVLSPVTLLGTPVQLFLDFIPVEHLWDAVDQDIRIMVVQLSHLQQLCDAIILIWTKNI